jgi:hypothetical protein
VFVSVPLKLLTFVAPAPALNPVATVGATHVYVVLSGILPDKVGVKEAPLHTVMLTLLIAADGNTDTVAVKLAPVQPLEVGLMIYVPVITAFVLLVIEPLKLD